MKVSLNTIRQYLDFDLPPVDELVQRINEQLGGVEEVIDLTQKYKDAVIVKVVAAEQHPNADRLNVCRVDDGGVIQDVERGDDGLVQVVCGAPNVHENMYAVWLPPRSVVPATYGSAEPIVLAARELRGVLSQGMLAGIDELGLSDKHESILEIDPTEWTPGDVTVKPGVSFAETYGLNDTIIDIENKMFTHRPDCFGQIGVAREIAGILGQKFTSPDWYWKIPEFETATNDNLPLQVFNDVPEKSLRFMTVAIGDVQVAPSPLWLQCELVRLGGKPINNIVDATNYTMLLTAQPVHAYDYDKLRGNKLGVRMANGAEKATLLNGKEYELSPDDIVIVDGEGVIGLAGIMGGLDSEVTEETKNLVLEVASFDMYTVRKTSMRHGVFTDALTRFNKGQSPLQNDRVLNLLVKSIKDMAGGQLAGEVVDMRSVEADVYERQTIHGSLAVSTEFINERLGSELNDEDIQNYLQNVEFAAYPEGGSINITAPYWRTDIELPEDIVEEVGRLYGFDKLPRTLPMRSSAPVTLNPSRKVQQNVRSSLARAGANEVLTYSFVHQKVLENAGQDVAKAYKLSNALSPDLQYYRLSVTPSLLDKVHQNIKAGYDEFVLYEIGKSHHKDEQGDDGLPHECSRVAAAYASKNMSKGAAFYQAKRLLSQLVTDLGMGTVRYEKLADVDYQGNDNFRQLAAPFDPERSAMVWVGEKFGGVVGEYTRVTKRGFKLPVHTAGFELFLSRIASTSSSMHNYVPLSRFPSISQDISLKTSTTVSYAQIASTIAKSLEDISPDIQAEMQPISIYQADGNSDSKTTTFGIKFTHSDRTLSDADITPIVQKIADTAKSELSAERA